MNHDGRSSRPEPRQRRAHRAPLPIPLVAFLAAACGVALLALRAEPKRSPEPAAKEDDGVRNSAVRPAAAKGCPTGAASSPVSLANGNQDSPAAKKKRVKRVQRGTSELEKGRQDLETPLGEAVDGAKCRVFWSASWKNRSDDGAAPSAIRLGVRVGQDGATVKIEREQGCSDCPLRVSWQVVEWE